VSESSGKFRALVLVVDDDQVSRELVRELLVKMGCDVAVASSGEAAVREIQTRSTKTFDLVVSDIRMLAASGLDVLKAARTRDPMTVVILMTGFGSMEGAVAAIREGAYDYISKPFKLEEFRAVVSRAVTQAAHLRALAKEEHTSAPKTVTDSPKTLIGKSAGIVEVYKTLARAALSDSAVLITGESGTGKELVARAIHQNGTRRSGKFVAINCGALTESLLESELFGYVKGAFTGAQADKPGLFDEANRGTLFLDEIGDLSLGLQVKLLRVLQEGEVRPVGSNQSHRVEVRVLSATHRDLQEMVKSGKFREDLLYRLKVIPIDIPPLRTRTEDLPELVSAFVARVSTRGGKAVSHLSDEAMAALSGYHWPGNVRELEHAIERAVALSRGQVLELWDFPPEISERLRGAEAKLPQESLESREREHILKVLQETGYHKSRASEILGIDRATLYRKAARYGIDLKGRD